jgi:thymidine kinase
MSKTGAGEAPRFVLLRGPMFSGKSTEMARLVGRESAVCERPNVECVIFKYNRDNRYGQSSDQALRTHGGGSVPAIAVGRADDIRLILLVHLYRLAADLLLPEVFSAAASVRERIVDWFTLPKEADEPIFVMDESTSPHNLERSQEQLKTAIAELTESTLAKPIPLSGLRLADYGVRMVGIDEGQFLPGLTDVVEWLVEEQGVSVVVSALDLNFRGEPWAETLRLQAYPPDEDIKLKARCKDCRSADGIYSFYYQEPQSSSPASAPASSSAAPKSDDVPEGLNASTFKIGGAERYKPLCRSCYRSASSQWPASKQ